MKKVEAAHRGGRPRQWGSSWTSTWPNFEPIRESGPTPVGPDLERGAQAPAVTRLVAVPLLTPHSTDPRRTALDEFSTLAILATGQDYASLPPPNSHDYDGMSSELSSMGRRLLTQDPDHTVRLWDPFTGRQVAVLRRSAEKVIEYGFSPDERTAFTHSLDGIVRLWETDDGAFRAETEPRPDRIKYVDSLVPDPFKVGVGSNLYITRLSNDRLLTTTEIRTGFRGNSWGSSQPGPIELWDAWTGRLITRLEIQKEDRQPDDFTGDGRWILAVDWKSTVHVWSAADGRPVANLVHDAKFGLLGGESPILSPSGRGLATIPVLASDSNRPSHFVHIWDTSTWQLTSITGPINEIPDVEVSNDYTLMNEG